jgi:hypothetical protein
MGDAMGADPGAAMGVAFLSSDCGGSTVNETSAENSNARPVQAVPLDYGKEPGVGHRQWNHLTALAAEWGGWRRIGFAVGLSLVLAGVGQIFRSDFAAWLLGIGGLLIGMNVHARLRQD